MYMSKTSNFSTEYFLKVINKLEEINSRLQKLGKEKMPENDKRVLERLIGTSDPYYLKTIPYLVVDSWPSNNKEGLSREGSYFFLYTTFSVDKLKGPRKNLNLKKEISAFEKLVKNAKKLKTNVQKIKTLDLRDLGLEMYEVWRKFILDYWKTFDIDVDLADVSKIKHESKHHEEWQNWEKLYAFSKKRRVEFAENLVRAIKENESKKEFFMSNNEILDGSNNIEIPSETKSFVYFIRNQDKYKIGITSKLLQCFEQIKPDEVLNVIRCSNFKELKQELHNTFKDSQIPHTEEFRLTLPQTEEVHRLIMSKVKL